MLIKSASPEAFVFFVFYFIFCKYSPGRHLESVYTTTAYYSVHMVSHCTKYSRLKAIGGGTIAPVDTMCNVQPSGQLHKSPLGVS